MPETGEMDAICLADCDNVATVLHAVAEADMLRIQRQSGSDHLLAAGAVPMCHKIALVTIAPGSPILKYGEVIGEATRPITAGTHVHVHNMRSRRGRAAEA